MGDLLGNMNSTRYLLVCIVVGLGLLALWLLTPWIAGARAATRSSSSSSAKVNVLDITTDVKLRDAMLAAHRVTAESIGWQGGR